MKIAHLSCLALISVALHAAAGNTNGDFSHSSAPPHHDWELVRSVSNSLGGTLDFLLIPKAKIRDLTNYQAAAEAIAGTRTQCLIFFWADRSQIPTSAQIPVTNLQQVTATYERHPSYESPQFQLACWLYPSEEAARRAGAFFNPGVKMPKTAGATTNKTSYTDP